MVHNTEKLDLATLYRKQGFSYTEIAKLCGVSKSTVSNWFKDQTFSKKIAKANAEKAAKANKDRIALLNKAKKTEREKQYSQARRSAEVEYRHYKKDPLFIAGVMLYSTEGDTTHLRLIRIASARMDLHKIFLLFSERYLGVERKHVNFWLLLYPELKEKDCVAAWTKALKLKPANFYKTQVVLGRSAKHTLQFGIGNTIIGNTVLKVKLNRWIELMTKELAK